MKTGTIEYTCSGAIDFMESVKFEVSDEYQEGFTKIYPSVFATALYIPHLSYVMMLNFLSIFRATPHPSDKNPDINIPFDKMYYKCYKEFHHSHDLWQPSKITPMTLEEAVNRIKEMELDLVPLMLPK